MKRFSWEVILSVSSSSSVSFCFSQATATTLTYMGTVESGCEKKFNSNEKLYFHLFDGATLNMIEANIRFAFMIERLATIRIEF